MSVDTFSFNPETDTEQEVPLGEHLEQDSKEYEERVGALTSERKFDSKDAICEHFNLAPEQAEAAITNAEAVMESSRVAIRIKPGTLEDILSTGNILSAHDTLKSTGGSGDVADNGYLLDRVKVESSMGLTPKSGEPNIIYGYLDSSLTLDYVTPHYEYGPVALILKPEVAHRSTYTIGDSLHHQYTKKSLLGFDDAVVAHEASKISSYTSSKVSEGVEAQILGGVSLKDIEAISVSIFGAAEVVSYDDLIKLGSKNAAKEAGKLRSEGKDYTMQDGDVVEFRFNL